MSILKICIICILIILKNNIICNLISINTNKYNYITVESDGGLANRLRVLISYYFIAKAYYDNYKLFMIWDINDACPGHFLSIFEPIDDVYFITSKGKQSIYNQSIYNYPNTREGFLLTMEKYNIDSYLKENKRGIRNIKKYLWKEEKELWYKHYIHI